MTACTHLQHQPALLNSDDFNSNSGHHPIRPAQAATDTPTRRDDGERDSSSFSTGGSSSIKDFTITSSVKNKGATKGNKRVSWDKIHTREFDLVVGDHPMCQDGLPVSLGWQYNDQSCSAKAMNPIAENEKEDGTKLFSSSEQQQQQQIKISERGQSYVFPRRLSYEERRDRLISVSNLTLDQIRKDEIDLVVRTLNESFEKEDLESYQYNDDVIMTHARDDDNIYPSVDEYLMDLDEIHVVPGIDVDFGDDMDADLSDITNFDWTNNL